ncbi:hypothetical protein N2W54_006843 [Lotmaria passim]
MNIVTSYFIVRKLPGTIALGGDVKQHRLARQAEYLDCLRYNRQHPGVAAVHLLVEGMEAYQHLVEHVLSKEQAVDQSDLPGQQCDDNNGKSTANEDDGSSAPASGVRRRHSLAPLVPILRLGGGMPTYADLFAHANQLTSHRLTMVCNADVYLSPENFNVADVDKLFRQARVSTRKQQQQHGQAQSVRENNEAPREAASSSTAVSCSPTDESRPRVKMALALTRYESDHLLDAPFLYDYRGSHDAFVFMPPVPASFLAGVQHAQNGYKAENVVVHEFQQQGYLMLNPAFDLRLVHRHAADVRQWFPPVDESRYGRAYPCTLAEASTRIGELGGLRASNPLDHD